MEEGDTAEFSCFFTETSSTPCWIINGTVYSIDELPSGHSYRNHTLLVTDVDSSLNSTTYQCQILHIMSSLAILTVFPGSYSIGSCITNIHRRRKVEAGGARAPPIFRRWGLSPLKNDGL